MKLLPTHHTYLFIAGLAALAMLSLSGCASSGLHHKTTSPLPIEVLDSTGGEITGTRAFVSGQSLFVAGTKRKHRGHHLSASAHVDVQLLDRAGRVLAEQADDIDPAHPTLSQGRSGRYSFVVSFPLAVAKRAAGIRVTYHRSSH